MLNSLVHPLLSIGGWEGYLLVAFFCFGEAAFFLGFFLPGETAVVFGGILASEHELALVPLLALVVGCAVAGDSVGYAIGRRYGPRLLETRLLRNRPAVGRARAFVERRGAPAVFIGRFTALFRTLVPGMAGVSYVRYSTFLVANAAGGLLWGVGYTLAGYYIGQKILKTGSYVSYGIIGAAAVVLLALEVRRRRRERAERRAGHGAALAGEERPAGAGTGVALPVEPGSGRE